MTAVARTQVAQAACGSGGIGGSGLAAAVWPSITAGGVAASLDRLQLVAGLLTDRVVDVPAAERQVDRIVHPAVDHQLRARRDQQHRAGGRGAGLPEPDLRHAAQIGRRVQRVVRAVQDRLEAGRAQFVGDGLGLAADRTGVVDPQQDGRRVRRADRGQALVIGVPAEGGQDLGGGGGGRHRIRGAVVAAALSPAEASRRATLRVVGAVVTGAGPGALQALLFSGLGRRLGNQTTAAPTSSTTITVRAGQYRRRR